MTSMPVSTKILIIALIFVAGRFFWAISFKLSHTDAIVPQQSKSLPKVQQILTCEQYTAEIRECTSEAMICLQEIAKQKKIYEQRESSMLKCQAQNEKNLQLNKDLRLKLDVVTQKLDELINQRKKVKQQAQAQQKTQL